jgi:hypothetical protein
LPFRGLVGKKHGKNGLFFQYLSALHSRAPIRVRATEKCVNGLKKSVCFSALRRCPALAARWNGHGAAPVFAYHSRPEKPFLCFFARASIRVQATEKCVNGLKKSVCFSAPQRYAALAARWNGCGAASLLAKPSISVNPFAAFECRVCARACPRASPPGGPESAQNMRGVFSSA